MMNSSRSARSGYTQRTGYTARTHPSHRAPSVSGSVASGSVQGGRHDGTFRSDICILYLQYLLYTSVFTGKGSPRRRGP